MINVYVKTYNKVFVMLLEQIQKLTASNGVALEVVNGTHTVYQAACGELTSFLGLQVPLENTFSGECFHTQKPVACSDIFNSKNSRARVAKMTFANSNIQSMVLIPVVHDGNCISIIKLASENALYFNEDNASEFEEWVAPLVKSIIAAMQDASKLAKQKQQHFDQINLEQLHDLHTILSPDECDYRGFIALQALSNMIKEGVFVTNSLGECIYANESYLKIRDMIYEEVLKNGWTQRIDKHDLEILYDEWNKAVANQSNFVSEYRCYSKSGIPKRVRALAVPLRDGEQFFGYLGTLIEIAPNL